jgi:hypothetical protein
MIPDAYEPFRQAIRAKGRKITPYRLGYAVSLANSPLPCPYKTLVSVNAFRAGLRYGALRRNL